MQSLLMPSRGLRSDKINQELMQTCINRLFGFAYAWALGGNLVHTVRDDFDGFVRDQLQPVLNFPGKDTGFRASGFGCAGRML